MTDRELMQQALEALMDAQLHNYALKHKETDALITALRERLAQPEQEPVALETVYDTIIRWDETDGKRSRRELARRIIALYTTPPRRDWVGLTDEERNNLWRDVIGWGDPSNDDEDLMKVIEAKLKEKNA